MNSPQQITKLLTTTLYRFHMVIFIVAVVASLAAAVLLLNGIILKTSSVVSVTDGTTTSFDQATIDQIKQLKTSSEPSTPLDFSHGRISPFSE